jgi:hypothetical protein
MGGRVKEGQERKSAKRLSVQERWVKVAENSDREERCCC